LAKRVVVVAGNHIIYIYIYIYASNVPQRKENPMCLGGHGGEYMITSKIYKVDFDLYYSHSFLYQPKYFNTSIQNFRIDTVIHAGFLLSG